MLNNVEETLINNAKDIHQSMNKFVKDLE